MHIEKEAYSEFKDRVDKANLLLGSHDRYLSSLMFDSFSVINSVITKKRDPVRSLKEFKDNYHKVKTHKAKIDAVKEFINFNVDVKRYILADVMLVTKEVLRRMEYNEHVAPKTYLRVYEHLVISNLIKEVRCL